MWSKPWSPVTTSGSDVFVLATTIGERKADAEASASCLGASARASFKSTLT